MHSKNAFSTRQTTPQDDRAKLLATAEARLRPQIVRRRSALGRLLPDLEHQRLTPMANFRGLILGCIEAKFCKKICV